MSSVESGAAWTAAAESPRTIEMRERLRRIDDEIVEQKRLHRAFGGSDRAARIERLKISAGRIRAHLKRGVYG